MPYYAYYACLIAAESRQLVRTPLPFSTRHLLSAHAVQGEIYLLRAESESCEFAAAEVYAIGTALARGAHATNTVL